MELTGVDSIENSYCMIDVHEIAAYFGLYDDKIEKYVTEIILKSGYEIVVQVDFEQFTKLFDAEKRIGGNTWMQ